MAVLLWSKMKSVYKMVASRPERIALIQVEKYYARKTWQEQMCSW
jgi:hypothetical protein